MGHPRIGEDVRKLVLYLHRQYRGTWGVREIAYYAPISPTTVAKILRERFGPRPRPRRPSHTRRTRFLASNVMWSSDGTKGGVLLKTLDESSLYKLGWDLVEGEKPESVLAHIKGILASTEARPLIWKFDRGSAFRNKDVRNLLTEHGIVPYYTARRTPWTNGRTENDNGKILKWLAAGPSRYGSGETLRRDIDEGIFMLNFIRPRPVLGYRTSATAHFRGLRATEAGRADLRAYLEARKDRFAGRGGESRRRKAIRTWLQRSGLYQEWDTLPRLSKKVPERPFSRIPVRIEDEPEVISVAEFDFGTALLFDDVLSAVSKRKGVRVLYA